jgi:dipeptidyl aminopeptidase/acylaminoacyl peptidase
MFRKYKHGAKDERVPIAQAESLKDAFDKIDKHYEWLEISDEGHGFSNLENRKEVYGKILEFLDDNIGTAK